MPTTQRVQLDLPAQKVSELDSLMKEVGITTRKDFFNQALTLLVWAIKERKKGRIIASVDQAKKEFSEVVMPVLDIRT